MSTGLVYKVLVTDKDTFSGILTVREIESLGYRAEVVSSEARALAALTEKSYDAVLMCCETPGLDGYGIARRLRRDPRFEYLPLIGYADGAGDELRAKCREAGMVDCLPKPLRREDVARTLQRHLTGRLFVAGSGPSVSRDARTKPLFTADS